MSPRIRISTRIIWSPAPPKVYFKLARFVIRMAWQMWLRLIEEENIRDKDNQWEQYLPEHMLQLLDHQIDGLIDAVAHRQIEADETLWASAADVANLAGMVAESAIVTGKGEVRMRPPHGTPGSLY